jgi:hypothetical protein
MLIRPDPGMDPKMAVEAPASIDPKIARKSACAVNEPHR